MLNKYPLWKTLLVALTVAIGFLYAVPNLYEPDHALQISGIRGADVNVATFERVKSRLGDSADIKSVTLENVQILALFNGLDSQLKAR